jgi:hypothetical protein
MGRGRVLVGKSDFSDEARLNGVVLSECFQSGPLDCFGPHVVNILQRGLRDLTHCGRGGCISFTVVVKFGEVVEGRTVKSAKAAAKRPKPEPDPSVSVRATISFPSDRYATLEEIAKQKKVSLAWVVREAVDKYITDKWPLFSHGG